MEWINSSHMGETTLIPQISISTITTTLKLNCTFNLVDIYKCVKLDANKIIGFKCNGWVKIKLGENIVYLPPAPKDDDDESIIESTKPVKKLSSHYNEIKSYYNNLKIKRSQYRFFNQVTVYIKLSTDRYINVKIFKNGSLQMTGIKKISECNIIIDKLLNEIKNNVNSNLISAVPTTGVLLPEFITKTYPANTVIKLINKGDEDLKVLTFSIRMINSNCKVPFKINRDALFQLLKADKIKCRYDPNSHACVNIRHDINETDNVSIFVFQSGSIIITGGKTISDINKGYHYIMNIISKHYETIKKKDLDEYIHSLKKDDTDNEEDNSDGNENFVNSNVTT
jgi:TATA-box binding protein (TBP) (component of TFIID and TFIIIB)